MLILLRRERDSRAGECRGQWLWDWSWEAEAAPPVPWAPYLGGVSLATATNHVYPQLKARSGPPERALLFENAACRSRERIRQANHR